METRTDNEGSDLVDPLADCSPISFFSRSLNLPSSSTDHLPNPNSSISEYLHARLKARVLSSPDKLLKQATSILEGCSDHLQADKSEAVSTNNEKVLRERRPALGLKRPQFSIKPIPSQPAVRLQSSVGIDKLSDPDDFFDAFERMEDAKKEVAKLKGEPLVVLDQNRASLGQRPRRPGLLGKSYTYTHRPYPSLPKVDAHEILLPSQETYDDDMLSPAHHDVVPDAKVSSNSSSMRVSDSKATTTSKVSELDELLSCNFEGLDEDGVQNLLLDKLRIKSLDISENTFPDCRVSLHELLTTSTALPKSNETVIHSNGANLAASSKDMKSPSNSRSPLASISILNRHIAKRKPSNDLFPSLCFDVSPEKATNLTRESEKRVNQAVQSDKNDARSNMCNVRRSPVHGEEVTSVTGEDTSLSVENGVDQIISEAKEKEIFNGQPDQIGNQTELPENGKSPVRGEENIAGADVGPTSEPQNQNNEVAAVRESAWKQLIFEDQDMENPSLNEVEKVGMDEPLNLENSFAEALTQETVGSSKRTLVEQCKSKASSEAVVSDVPSKRRKLEGAGAELSKGGRKFSLYCAGTKIDKGVRRSTRIRWAPLNFWKGERVYYGRVHESLPTVIAVKYSSPTKEAEHVAKAKVKSLVSDEYKDLIEKASLY